MDFITREEALTALEKGERVLFHYRGKTTEVNLNTTLEDLRGAFLAKLTLTVNDVLNGKYSLIKQHELKTWTEYYKAVVKGDKTFEIRKNDRNFQVGDRLILKEYDPDKQTFTGEQIEKEVVYLTDFGQQDDFVVMAIA